MTADLPPPARLDAATLRQLIREARSERTGAIRAARTATRQWRQEIERLAIAAAQLRIGFDPALVAEQIAPLLDGEG